MAFLHSWHVVRSHGPPGVPVVSCVELCDAACSAVAPQVCTLIGNGWKTDCTSTPKAGADGWLGSRFLSSPPWGGGGSVPPWAAPAWPPWPGPHDVHPDQLSPMSVEASSPPSSWLLCPPSTDPCSRPGAAASSRCYLGCCRGRLSRFPGAVALQEARYQILSPSQTLPEPEPCLSICL